MTSGQFASGQDSSAATDRQPSELSHDDLVRTRLLTSVDRIKAGDTFLVGVEFGIKDGWHIYWRDPGNAGMATSVTFTLPAGFRTGELQWPVPIRFTQAGGIVGYGYENRVVLWAEVVAPPADQLKDITAVPIGAKVSWLCCEKICVPGRASLTHTLPLADASKPSTAHSGVFTYWQQRLPKTARSHADHIAGIRTSGMIAADNDTGTIHIEITWRDTPTQVQWFPGSPQAISVENVQVSTQRSDAGGGTTLITAHLTVFPGFALESPYMHSVVTFEDDTGNIDSSQPRIRGLALPVRIIADDDARMKGTMLPANTPGKQASDS